MLKKNLYIIVEHKNRELISQVLLSTFAIKKGLRVYLGNYRGIFKLLSLKKEKSGLLMMKGGLNENLTKLIKKKCDKYIILDQEISPGYKKFFYNNWVSDRFLRQTIRYIDLYCCLNDAIYDASKTNKAFRKEKIKLFKSGWPRVDTWSPIFENFYKKEVKLIKNKYKNFILFSSDFGVTSKEDFEEELERIPWGTKKKDIQKIKKKNLLHAKKQYIEYKKFILFLKKIDTSPKCPKILVRSHPGESLIGWQKDLVNLKNIIYIKPSKSIDPYIYACSGFLHRGTTTAYQAILANKPLSFIYLDKHVKKVHLNKPNLMKESKIIKNPENFLLWSQKILKKKDYKKNIKFKVSKNIINDLNLHEGYSSRLIIDKLYSLGSAKDERLKYKFLEITFKDKIVYKIKNTIKDIIGFFNFKKKIIFNDFKVRKLDNSIQSKEIKSIINKFNKLLKLNIRSKVQVNQISENVVEIETI